MPAKDLGTKFTCFKCGTRFYDLKKPEPMCPKCGADQRQSPANKPSPAAEKRRAAKPPPPPPAPEAPEIDAEAAADDDAEPEEDETEADEDEP